MAEHVIDLTGVEVKTIKEAHSIEAIEALWGLPVREEIVRCRDCESACDHYEGMDVWWCGYLQRYVGSNGFCFWGVRRAGA